MAAVIRDYAPESDAESVAEFFNAQRYGPVLVGHRLTSSSLARVLEERDVRLLMLAEQGGRIVGTIGFARVSGRRVAGDDELFAGMFLIAPSHRSGFLAGQLFTESFARLVTSGIRALRLEVDPSNMKAFPLYVRVGFRAVAGLRPDEDGYVELVSTLPGVTAELLEAFADYPEVRRSLPRFGWRALPASRQSITDGVDHGADGRATISYGFQVGKLLVEAVTDVADHRIIRVTVDGVEDRRFPKDRPERVPADAPPGRAIGEFVANVDRHGTLHVRHPRHRGTVHSEPFPVDSTTPVGARRPSDRPVRITETEDGWLAEHAGIRRVVTLLPGGMSVRTSGAGAVRSVLTPGLRVREASIVTAAVPRRSEHDVRGRWPVDLTDFEAVADDFAAYPLQGSCAGWADGGSGLCVSVTGTSEGTARLEGPGLLLRSNEGALAYELSLTEGSARQRDQAPRPAAVPVVWREGKRGGRPVLVGEAGDAAVTVAPDHGLVEWALAGRTLLEGAFPSARSVGPLSGVGAALWAAVLGTRADADQGVCWTLADERLPFTTSRGPGWSISLLDDGSMAVVARLVEAPPDAEIAICLLAPGHPPAIGLEAADGRMIEAVCSDGPWRTWTRRVRIPVAAGGYVDIAPIEGDVPEILVRATRSGVLLTMLTVAESDRPSSWRLALEQGALA